MWKGVGAIRTNRESMEHFLGPRVSSPALYVTMF
jgi:hypothetical protein